MPKVDRECVTHHYACDCREKKFREMEEERALLVAACEAAENFIEATNPFLEVTDQDRIRARLYVKLEAWRAHTEARGR